MLKHLLKDLRWVLSLPRYTKRFIVIMIDVCLCALSVWLAFYLRLGEFVMLSVPVSWALAIALVIAMPIFVSFGLYRAIFRYSGFLAILAVAQALAVYGLVYASTITAVGVTGIPRTVGLIQPFLLYQKQQQYHSLNTLQLL